MSTVLAIAPAGAGALKAADPPRRGFFATLSARIAAALRARRAEGTVPVDTASAEWALARRDVHRLLDARLRAGRDAAGLASFPGAWHRPAGAVPHIPGLRAGPGPDF